MLQEHWLLPSKINFLQSIHPDFMAFGISAVSEDSALLVGRPYGGKVCAAVGCNNYQKDGKGLSFFRFPRDRDRYETHIASYNDTLWSLSFIDFIKIVYL
jgi:hypothetical protein